MKIYSATNGPHEHTRKPASDTSPDVLLHGQIRCLPGLRAAIIENAAMLSGIIYSRFIKGKGVGPLCPSVANCLSFLV